MSGNNSEDEEEKNQYKGDTEYLDLCGQQHQYQENPKKIGKKIERKNTCHPSPALHYLLFKVCQLECAYIEASKGWECSRWHGQKTNGYYDLQTEKVQGSINLIQLLVQHRVQSMVWWVQCDLCQGRAGRGATPSSLLGESGDAAHFSTLLHTTLLYCTLLYYTAHYSMALYPHAQSSTLLSYTAMYCSVHQWPVLHYFALDRLTRHCPS